jgi:hypothetical protein
MDLSLGGPPEGHSRNRDARHLAAANLMAAGTNLRPGSDGRLLPHPEA